MTSKGFLDNIRHDLRASVIGIVFTDPLKRFSQNKSKWKGHL